MAKLYRRPAVPVVLGLVALGLAGARAQALDAHRASSQYVLRDWDANAGLPSNSIHALLQTRDRYLWMGTSAGLVRFDGARFVVFDARNTPGFGDGVVTALAEGPDGSLFVGTTSAVVRYKNGTFEPLPIETGAGVVSSLLPARDGRVWVGLIGRPLYVYQSGRATPLTRELGTPSAMAMVEDKAGALWIGTRGHGLLRFTNQAFTTVDVGSDTVQALLLDRAGDLWIGTPHGLLRRRGNHVERFTRRQGLTHENISAILEDRHGNIWIGTAGGGVNRFRDGHIDPLTSAQGLSDDVVRSLLEDDEGQLWVGTANGLDRLSDGRFVTYGRLEGLVGDAVSAVAPASDGGAWLGVPGGVAHLRHDGTFRRFPLPTSVGPETVLVLHEARDGTVWIGADNRRLYRLRGGTITDATLDPGGKVTTIFDDHGELLFYMRGIGLARIVGGQLQTAHYDARRLSYVYSVFHDRAGTLWLCGAVGLGRVRGAEFRMFTTVDGLPHDRVRSAVEDRDGTLWLATIGGLARLRGETIQSLTTRHGLPENHLRLVLDDGLGHLWLASASHVFRLDKREIAAVLDGAAPRVAPLVFDASDGLRSTETLLGSGPGFRAKDGRLWFATARGVAVVDPSLLTMDDPAPTVHIESVRVDGRTEAGHEYRPGRGEVRVEYTSLSFRNSSRSRFRYRLDGFDPDWVDAGPQRTAYYSSLPPGRYRLLVEASNHDGVWNGRPAEWSFSLRPPFHRTPIFYAACAALLAALLAAAHRIRVAQIQARVAAVFDERTRIARELHDTIAQSLTGMGLQIEAALASLPPEPTSRARRYLQRARTMVTAGLEDVRRSIWVLRAQADSSPTSLGTSLSEGLTNLASHSSAQLSVRVDGAPRSLPAEIERNLLRIAHEAVTNAVRHSGASHIAVALEFEDRGVRLRVHDDGRGFDPAATGAQTRGQRFGLVGMAERAYVMKGELSVRSRPGEGTEIDCHIPYEGAVLKVDESHASRH